MKRFQIWVVALVAFTCLLPGIGVAGAWLRDREQGFASTYVTLRQPQSSLDDALGLPSWEGKFFAEYGLRDWVTVGVDGFETGYTYGHLLGFARFPVLPRDRSTKWSLELSVGAAHDEFGEWQPKGKVTTSLGRNYAFWSLSGWWNLDFSSEMQETSAAPLHRAEATIGLKPSKRVGGLLKSEIASLQRDPVIWAITPMVSYHAPNGRTWLLGVEYRSVKSLSSTGIKAEMWWNF